MKFTNWTERASHQSDTNHLLCKSLKVGLIGLTQWCEGTNRTIVSVRSDSKQIALCTSYWNALRVSERRNWDGNKSDNKGATATYNIVSQRVISCHFFHLKILQLIRNRSCLNKIVKTTIFCHELLANENRDAKLQSLSGAILKSHIL